MPRLASLAPAALGLVLLAFLALFPAAVARAEPFALRSDDWEGLAQFGRAAEVELGTGRVVLTSTLDLHALDPADGVLIVHPTRTVDVDGLSAFMHGGGRVVLLDDYGTGDQLLEAFGIRRRALPAHPAEMLRGNPALAIAEPAMDHPVVRDVARVVTNHATGLEHPGLSPLLVVRADGAHGEADVVLALAGTVGRGRLLALGDASVVINSMLRYPGDHALALSLVRYAVEDEAWGKRGGKLYVVTNEFATTGSFGDESPLLAAASEVRRAAMESLDGLRRDGIPGLAAYLAALAVGVGIVGWAVARAGKTHKVTTPRFSREVPVVAHGGIAGHAAVLGAPGTSRALAVVELKSALEEELATRLGLQRAPPAEQLVARLRVARLLDENGARSLSGLFATMARIEGRLGRLARDRNVLRDGLRDGPSDAQVLRLAAEVRTVLARLDTKALANGPGAADRARRDTFEKTP
jgi:hypothetical protein